MLEGLRMALGAWWLPLLLLPWHCLGDTYQFYKFFYSNSTSVTLIEKSVIPRGLSLALSYCGLLCGQEAACTFFRVPNGLCLLYAGPLPQGAALQDVGGDMIMAHTNGTILEDLALNAEVTGIPNHTDYPVPYSALVDGTLGTRTSKYDCPTTEASKDPHITINLRQEKTITLIVVTASISHRAPNFKSLEIYVGNTGNYAQDSLITTTNTVHGGYRTVHNLPQDLLIRRQHRPVSRPGVRRVATDRCMDSSGGQVYGQV
ncbi:hypothetical protein Hamer_G026774, partial [Homarus americanus]